MGAISLCVEIITVPKYSLPLPRPRVVWAGFNRIEDWNPVPSRPWWRLYWNPTPGATITFAGTDYRLDHEKTLLMPPDTRFEQKLMNPFENLFVHFSLGMPGDRLRDRAYCLNVSASLKRDLLTLTELIRAHPESVACRCRLAAWIFSSLAAIPESDWPRRISDERIRRAAEAIESDPGRGWSVKELAAMAHLSVNAFIRAFRRALGITPHAYLQRLRMQYAERLLSETDRSIDEIAAACGFSDRNYLSRVFAEKHRQGPAAYRKSARGTPG